MYKSIRFKLFTFLIFISVCPLILFQFFNLNIISTNTTRLTELNIENTNSNILQTVDIHQKVIFRWLESSVFVLREKLFMYGPSSFDYANTIDVFGNKIPTWYFGGHKISFDNSLVDALLEKQKVPASILQLHNNKFVRIATNVRQPDGTRIIGTIIDSGPVYDCLIKGKIFFGRANVEGMNFATIYQPIYDGNNDLVGALVVGQREQEYDIIDVLKNMKVGATGFVSILDAQGNFIVHPELQGENIAGYSLVQEIMTKKEGKITYESNDILKVAYFLYYEPWKWYIITTCDYNELQEATYKIAKILTVFCVTLFAVSVAISYLLSAAFFRPIEALTHVMQEVQGGNLNARFNHDNDDEFKTVSFVFNNMLNNISKLISRVLESSSSLKDSSFNLIDDIAASTDALNCMSNSVEGLRQSVVYCGQSNSSTCSTNEDILHDIEDLISLFTVLSHAKAEPGRDQFVGFTERLDDLRRKYIMQFIVGHDPSKPSHSVSFQNKISNIEVELAKLKLLIRYISNSASCLDDIAISLDRFVNTFNVDSGAD